MEKDSIEAGFLHLDVPKDRSALDLLLKQLNKYKELFAITAFVVGGVLWVFGYFVTKTQFKELRCFARESIRLNRAELKLRDTDAAITLSSRRSLTLSEKAKQSGLTEDELQEKVRVDAQWEQLKDRRKTEQDTVNKAESQLLDNSCSAGE